MSEEISAGYDLARALQKITYYIQPSATGANSYPSATNTRLLELEELPSLNESTILFAAADPTSGPNSFTFSRIISEAIWVSLIRLQAIFKFIVPAGATATFSATIGAQALDKNGIAIPLHPLVAVSTAGIAAGTSFDYKMLPEQGLLAKIPKYSTLQYIMNSVQLTRTAGAGAVQMAIECQDTVSFRTLMTLYKTVDAADHLTELENTRVI